MFSCANFCYLYKSAKVRGSSSKEPAKNETELPIVCNSCEGKKNILTLPCKHYCCIRCYNKEPQCSECNK